jgi:Nucleotidyltransferase of unknown function (DUF6036)
MRLTSGRPCANTASEVDSLAVSSRQLLRFLGEVQKVLERRIVLVAAGGTAMTLYGLKPSTIDVDFTGSAEDVGSFGRAVKMVQPGFRVDLWPNGQIFSQFLPSDYLSKSRRIKVLRKIELRALAPLDIVVTKIGKLDQRDLDDIEVCIKKFRLRRDDVALRAKRIEYAGNQKLFDANLKTVGKLYVDPGKNLK